MAVHGVGAVLVGFLLVLGLAVVPPAAATAPEGPPSVSISFQPNEPPMANKTVSMKISLFGRHAEADVSIDVSKRLRIEHAQVKIHANSSSSTYHDVFVNVTMVEPGYWSIGADSGPIQCFGCLMTGWSNASFGKIAYDWPPPNVVQDPLVEVDLRVISKPDGIEVHLRAQPVPPWPVTVGRILQGTFKVDGSSVTEQRVSWGETRLAAFVPYQDGIARFVAATHVESDAYDGLSNPPNNEISLMLDCQRYEIHDEPPRTLTGSCYDSAEGYFIDRPVPGIAWQPAPEANPAASEGATTPQASPGALPICVVALCGLAARLRARGSGT